MAITVKDEELIEYGFVMAFLSGLPQNTETAKKALAAWDQLLALMERENNYSNQLGSNVLDWQIGNWTNDLTMLLHNAGRYKDLIKVNEQILRIDWKNDGDNNLFHENAKRDIADAYEYRKYKAKTLSEVETDYLNTIKMLEQKSDKK